MDLNPLRPKLKRIYFTTLIKSWLKELSQAELKWKIKY
jgi:hypothetical protein